MWRPLVQLHADASRCLNKQKIIKKRQASGVNTQSISICDKQSHHWVLWFTPAASPTGAHLIKRCTTDGFTSRQAHHSCMRNESACRQGDLPSKDTNIHGTVSTEPHFVLIIIMIITIIIRSSFGSSCHFGTNATLDAERLRVASCTCVSTVPGPTKTLRLLFCFSWLLSTKCLGIAPMCGVRRRKCTDGNCRYLGGGAAAWETGSARIVATGTTGQDGMQEVLRRRALVGVPLDDLAKAMVTAELASQARAPRAVSCVEMGARQAMFR